MNTATAFAPPPATPPMPVPDLDTEVRLRPMSTWDAQFNDRVGGKNEIALAHRLWAHLEGPFKKLPSQPTVEQVVDAGERGINAFLAVAKDDEKPIAIEKIEYMYGAILTDPNADFAAAKEHKRRMLTAKVQPTAII
jgi:hypothetical protein